MPAITNYIVKQLLLVTLVVTVGLTFAVWLAQSLRFFDYIVNRGLPATTFFLFVGLLLPSFLAVVLPIATFCAVLFVYNRLIVDSELIVLRAAGWSQAQLARPALLVAAAMTILVYAIALYFLPVSYRAFKDLQYQIRSDASIVLLQEGVFNDLADGITVYVRERTHDGELRGILVHDSREPDHPVSMMAERGALVRSEAGPRVVMANGNRQELDRATGRVSLLYFDRYTIEVAKLSDVPETRWLEPKERFLPDLLFPQERSRNQRHRLELLAEGHRRLAGPLYTMVFVVIGLGILLSGQFNRRGQLHRLIAAVLVIALLEGLALVLHDLSGRTIQAIPLMYATVVVALAGGFYLMLRKPRRRAAVSPLSEPAS